MSDEKKKVPPSKARYLLRNPMVSFHLPAELLERLRKKATEDGVTIATYVRNYLTDLTVRDDDVKKAREDAFTEGYDAGFAAARRKYEIRCECFKCGGLITVEPGSTTHHSVRIALRRIHWGHADCVSKRACYRQ